MVPARQHLGAYHAPRGVAVLRLEVRHELAAFERCDHLASELLLLEHRRAQLLVVKHVLASRVAALRGAQGQQRAVAHEADVEGGIVDREDAQAHEEREVLAVGGEPRVEAGEHAVGIERGTWAAAHEMVGTQTSGHRARRHEVADHSADVRKKAVARRRAEQVVIDLEAVDVTVHEQVRLVGVAVYERSHALVEPASAQQPRERVVVRNRG